MMYIRPEDVLSPRDKVKNLEIIINNDKEDYSIALLEYNGTECVGVRWNTTNEEKDNIGTPQSRGIPTWFILPKEIAEVYLEKFLKEKEKKENDLKNRIKLYLKK
ncbi:hypothetical protein [Leptotrichia alba]|uniref:Uncharacterized protein n=1 Tax=Leptotrichia alba TaxID=3239304 RepID=A0AB39V321_9FUSO